MMKKSRWSDKKMLTEMDQVASDLRNALLKAIGDTIRTYYPHTESDTIWVLAQAAAAEIFILGLRQKQIPPDELQDDFNKAVGYYLDTIERAWQKRKNRRRKRK